jgi:hypothetical protein
MVPIGNRPTQVGRHASGNSMGWVEVPDREPGRII